MQGSLTVQRIGHRLFLAVSNSESRWHARLRGKLLLDEPLGSLDALTRLEMQALIEKIWVQRRFSVVLVTHDLEEAVVLADRVLVMEQGQFVFEQEIPLTRPRARTSPVLVE